MFSFQTYAFLFSGILFLLYPYLPVSSTVIRIISSGVARCSASSLSSHSNSFPPEERERRLIFELIITLCSIPFFLYLYADVLSVRREADAFGMTDSFPLASIIAYLTPSGPAHPFCRSSDMSSSTRSSRGEGLFFSSIFTVAYEDCRSAAEDPLGCGRNGDYLR